MPRNPRKTIGPKADSKHHKANEERASNAYCPFISALYEVAASVRENLHEFKVDKPQLLEDDFDDIDDINQITVNRIQ